MYKYWSRVGEEEKKIYWELNELIYITSKEVTVLPACLGVYVLLLMNMWEERRGRTKKRLQSKHSQQQRCSRPTLAGGSDFYSQLDIRLENQTRMYIDMYSYTSIFMYLWGNESSLISPVRVETDVSSLKTLCDCMPTTKKPSSVSVRWQTCDCYYKYTCYNPKSEKVCKINFKRESSDVVYISRTDNEHDAPKMAHSPKRQHRMTPTLTSLYMKH